MSSDYICNKHDFALKRLAKIRDDIYYKSKRYGDDAEELLDLLDDIDSNIYDVIDKIEEAKDMGIKMENRLEKYRNAIEDLGFVRNE